MKKILTGAAVLVLCFMPFFAQDSLAAASAQADEYTGWVEGTSKELSVRSGAVQIRVKPNLGTFNFSVLNENDKYVPVLSTANEYASSGFFLKAGKKRYRLIADKSVRPAVAKLPGGFNITYFVAKTAEVSVNFETLRSNPESDVDMIKISAFMRNTGDRTDDYALRLVLDTILGESADYHFFGADSSPIKSEALYRSLKKDQRWVYSKNANGAMQVLFDGADITEPELVALANYSTLDKAAWEPDMKVFRTFDTVLSYKNSAIGINWPAVRLRPGQSASCVIYIALASDGNLPKGELFVDGDSGSWGAADLELEREFVAAAESTAENVQEGPVEIQMDEPAAPKAEFEVRRDVPFTVNSISKEHLTLEYVQNLIDRISALEENSAAVNRREILQLNAELDAILSVLRQL